MLRCQGDLIGLPDTAQKRELHHATLPDRREPLLVLTALAEQGQETDAARERLRPPLQRLGEALDVAHEEALCQITQSDVDQRRELAFDGQEVRDHAEHGVPRPRLRLFDECDHLPYPGAETLPAADQTVQHGRAARKPTALLPQFGHDLYGTLAQLSEAI